MGNQSLARVRVLLGKAVNGLHPPVNRGRCRYVIVPAYLAQGFALGHPLANLCGYLRCVARGAAHRIPGPVPDSQTACPKPTQAKPACRTENPDAQRNRRSGLPHSSQRCGCLWCLSGLSRLAPSPTRCDVSGQFAMRSCHSSYRGPDLRRLPSPRSIVPTNSPSSSSVWNKSSASQSRRRVWTRAHEWSLRSGAGCVDIFRAEKEKNPEIRAKPSV